MVANVQLCQELGYITAPKGMIRQLSAEAETLPDERVLVLCTGSQGEEFSALVRMSKSDFKDFTLKPEDGIILSSHFELKLLTSQVWIFILLDTDIKKI